MPVARVSKRTTTRPAHLLDSTAAATDWALGGNEGRLADLLVITKEGEILHRGYRHTRHPEFPDRDPHPRERPRCPDRREGLQASRSQEVIRAEGETERPACPERSASSRPAAPVTIAVPILAELNRPDRRDVPRLEADLRRRRSRRSRKSPFSGATNNGSATRLSLSCPVACHSAKLIGPKRTGLPEAFQYRLRSKAHTSRPRARCRSPRRPSPRRSRRGSAGRSARTRRCRLARPGRRD